MNPKERDVSAGDRKLRVREAGDPDGPAIVYFHGTPGSRLDLAFGDGVAAEAGVRLVSFDRPGYGGSTPARYGLTAVARDALAIADALGIDRFATVGMSGGGPFALATAAVGGGRVTTVGVASGAGPFQHVPGAIESLSEGDKAAERLLPEDREGAAEGFAAGFETLAETLGAATDADALAYFDAALSERDRIVLSDPEVGPATIASWREGLSAGVKAGGWDNVAWIGDWDFDLADVTCPVILWYGDQDRFAPVAHGACQAGLLPNARLEVRPGEGHFGLWEHLAEVLQELAAARPD